MDFFNPKKSSWCKPTCLKILSRRRDGIEEQDGNTRGGVIRLMEF